MSFIKNIFSQKDAPINTYQDFWDWFMENEKDFHKVISTKGDIEAKFFEKLHPKLKELNEGFWYSCGMHDENTAELIITPEGVVKNIVFVEELIKEAPALDNWKFTALKQAEEIDGQTINIGGHVIGADSLSFYPVEHKKYPDEIDIVITYKNYKKEDEDLITNGVYIFLDILLGELNSICIIDNLKIISEENVDQELIPISKLPSYLVWREKEFVEKYNGLRYNTDNDNFAGLNGTVNGELPLIALLNTDLLKWDAKASHPWVSIIEFTYDGGENSGLPSDEDYKLLDEIEDEITALLKDSEGYLNVGRQTAENTREIYFACHDFRLPSKVFKEIEEKYTDQFEIDYSIYKDKYWQTFNRFLVS
ncbi:DUF695 domain-containing protein [Flammeovirga aprica]|uniref:DUF695 domain-containing protein n=1 Tax=Flammeovirga aprica JL-4 TaxID=694437 RepID=A0A7X9RZ51_9BACT|nr:DUF695 domain-containing protein [Flammeovirga aprica]NME71433.1 DUF695 domain-containing protein [Flammeovirga aprica JL-4]